MHLFNSCSKLDTPGRLGIHVIGKKMQECISRNVHCNATIVHLEKYGQEWEHHYECAYMFGHGRRLRQSAETPLNRFYSIGL